MDKIRPTGHDCFNRPSIYKAWRRQPIGEKMKATLEKEDRTRAVPRNPIEAAITCQLYTSHANGCASEGVMRNFSMEGSYIETCHQFKSGTILIVRIVKNPLKTSSGACVDHPRSICLAEVKWYHEIAEKNANRFGLGLRYLV